MNEIITKLNEIEEKADAILSDAKLRKVQMQTQLEADKREIDAKYDRLERKSVQALEERLRAEADVQLETYRRNIREAAEQLDDMFAAQKEELAEEIVKRVIQ